MSSRHDKDHPFEAGLPEQAMPEPNTAPLGRNAAMHELQRASETVLRLATQTHTAVARSDVAGADIARTSLERQLTLTTRMIDELLFGGSDDQPTTH
jgi:hypothetical protein